jgi:mono/diheme cytochrome c family protein
LRIDWLKKQKAIRSLLSVIAVILVGAIAIGGSMAGVLAQNNLASFRPVDPVPEQYQLGQSLYLEHCGTCHIAIPPAVFPTQTWKELLENRDKHYGVSVPPIIGPELITMWNYLQVFSRSLSDEDFSIPFRFEGSRYFQAFHPRVDLPSPLKTTSCVECHPAASQFDFHALTPEWEDAP